MKRIPFWKVAKEREEARLLLARVIRAHSAPDGARCARPSVRARRGYQTEDQRPAERGALGRIALAVLGQVRLDLAAGGALAQSAQAFLDDPECFNPWCQAAHIAPGRTRLALLRQESPKSDEDDDWE